MAVAKGPGDDFTKELLTNYCNLLNSQEPSGKTVFEVLIEKVQGAVRDGKISPSLEKALLPDSILSLRDREIKTLSPKEQKLIMNVFEAQLGSLDQVDEGYNSTESPTNALAQPNPLSTEEIKRQSQGFQKVLKTILNSSSKKQIPGSPDIRENLFSWEIDIKLDSARDAPLHSLLDVHKPYPSTFENEYILDQTQSHKHISIKGSKATDSPLCVKAPSQAFQLEQRASKLAQQIDITESSQQIRKITNTILLFCTSYIEKKILGPILEHIEVHTQNHPNTPSGIQNINTIHSKIDIQFSPTPPDSFKFEIQGTIFYIHKDAPDNHLATLRLNGSCICQVPSDKDDCLISQTNFKIYITIP